MLGANAPRYSSTIEDLLIGESPQIEKHRVNTRCVHGLVSGVLVVPRVRVVPCVLGVPGALGALGVLGVRVVPGVPGVLGVLGVPGVPVVLGLPAVCQLCLVCLACVVCPLRAVLGVEYVFAGYACCAWRALKCLWCVRTYVLYLAHNTIVAVFASRKTVSLRTRSSLPALSPSTWSWTYLQRR